MYDLTERLIPAEWFDAPAPSAGDAYKELLVRAAGSLGVGTARDLADYYRLNIPFARPLSAELVEEGRLLPARVEGWSQPAFLHPGRADARVGSMPGRCSRRSTR